jgi:two-component system chemotaxis sensor kinase CheA
MTNVDEVVKTFEGLGAMAERLTAADKDGIVSLGSEMEAAMGLLDGDAAAGGVIGQMLTLLQGVYQGQLGDSGAALRHLAGVIEGIVMSLKQTGRIEPDILKSAAAELDAALHASPADSPDFSRLEADINNVSALLAVLTPQDTADIKGAADKVTTFAAASILPETIRLLAREALDHLDAVIGGSSQGDLAAAVQIIGRICLQLQDESYGCDFSLKTGAFNTPAQTDPQESPTDKTAAPTPPIPAPLAQDSQTPPASADTAQPAAPQAQVAQPAMLAQMLPMDADMDLLKEYVTEALDHITAAETSLLALESDPGDVEQINTIFRAFHTIKGASGFLSLEHIQKLSHRSESLLDRARTGQIQITGGYADLALKSCDLLRSMIETVKVAKPGQELELPEQFAEWMENLADPEGHGFSSQSDAASPMRLGDILVAREDADRQQVEDAVAKQGDKPLGQTLIEDGVVPATKVAGALRTQKQMAPASTAESSVRVSTERMDQLINMVGELVIAQSMVAQDPIVMDARGERLARNVGHAGKIVRELQDLTMGLRMVPLRATFQKMARLVRDLSRKSGKNVQFITEGDDTEIDRGMVEVLNDPLVHMMRNAVDHGVESPEIRAKDGKARTGTVRLRAYHSAGNVVIELSDDGHGLDGEKILAKARQRGLVEASRDLSESEIFGLIFLPGFSTADKVTDVSGRGVGMDVVKKGIESLRGRVDITSQVGVGSTFTIRLPLTMAIADAMLLRVGNQRFLIPTISIEHSFRPTAGAISTVKGQGEMVMLRDHMVPMFRLYNLFGVPDAITEPLNALLIVIEGQSQRCAIMVDELLGQQQVVIKSLGQALGTVKGVSGGAILGDGRVGLVLDPSGVLQLAHTGGQAADKDAA